MDGSGNYGDFSQSRCATRPSLLLSVQHSLKWHILQANPLETSESHLKWFLCFNFNLIVLNALWLCGFVVIAASKAKMISIKKYYKTNFGFVGWPNAIWTMIMQKKPAAVMEKTVQWDKRIVTAWAEQGHRRANRFPFPVSNSFSLLHVCSLPADRPSTLRFKNVPQMCLTLIRN